jgi:hypothetical protein
MDTRHKKNLLLRSTNNIKETETGANLIAKMRVSASAIPLAQEHTSPKYPLPIFAASIGPSLLPLQKNFYHIP